MSNTLATLNPPESALPEFDPARNHALQIHRGLKLTAAATVALGLSLDKAKSDLGYSHGGDREQVCKLQTWSELVAAQTGLSYATCNRITNRAIAFRDEVLASRKKIDGPAKQFLKSVPAEWTPEHYDDFAEWLAGRFEANSLVGILDDLGFSPSGKQLPPPPSNPGDEDDTEKPSAEQLEFFTASDFLRPVAEVGELLVNPDEMARCLAALPLESCQIGNRTVTGLRDVVAALTKAHTAATAALKSKSKGN